MAWTDCPDRHTRTGATLCVCILALGLLGACSVAGPKRSPLPQEGPNLVEVYRDHITRESGGTATERRPAKDGVEVRPDDLAARPMTAAMRTAIQPLDQRFRRLPNPDLVMYVFPHLAKGRYPVPGYFTVFPMYESIEYAMPGESTEELPRELRREPPPAAAKASVPKAANGVAARAGSTGQTSAQ